MINTILFDLDGTLLPMDQEIFIKAYLDGMCRKMAHHGYDPELLAKTVWKGTGAMVMNNGAKTNEAVFWDCFCTVFGTQALEHMPLFDEFYSREFQMVKEACDFDERTAKCIHEIKDMGYQLILATNPLFPAIATQSRVRWAGLQPEDFALITAYENSRHCKPNPEYYRDILETMNLKAEECVMVGNDVTEDMIAGTLGMKTFLMTDCLINKDNQSIHQWPHGSFPELMNFIREL